MSTSLPESPNLQNLSKRAKSILKAHRDGDPKVCDLLRRLHPFANASAETILAADIKLADVQFALALTYGFKSWTDLKQHLEAKAGQPKQESVGPTGLELLGDGHQQDSFSLALCAVAARLGRPIDYETVFALSTNAYALGIVPGRGGECPAWWHMSGREHGLNVIARRAGLHVERIDLPPATETVWVDPNVQLERRKQWAPIIRRQIEAGRWVITSGGWDWKAQLPKLTPHCWWGVIMEARDDGTIRGACLNGRQDNPIAILMDQCWAIEPARTTGDALEADVTMLQQALGRILADRDPFRRPDTIWQPVFGLDAMDAWIEQMGRVPFCVECVDRSWSCAQSMAMVVFQGAQTVASYLAKRLDSFEPAMRPALRSVIAGYVSISEKMEPFLARKDGCGYRQVMGDLAGQQSHIDQVLRPLRAELQTVARDIGEAIREIR